MAMTEQLSSTHPKPHGFAMPRLTVKVLSR